MAARLLIPATGLFCYLFVNYDLPGAGHRRESWWFDDAAPLAKTRRR
ncbi:MAG TPA: hypothetical protein VGM05_12435 [Planctomycetaceae bacterium]